MGVWSKISYSERIRGEVKVIEGAEKAKAGLKVALFGKKPKNEKK